MQIYRLLRVKYHTLLRVYTQQVKLQRTQAYGLIQFIQLLGSKAFSLTRCLCLLS